MTEIIVALFAFLFGAVVVELAHRRERALWHEYAAEAARWEREARELLRNARYHASLYGDLRHVSRAITHFLSDEVAV